jgi:hypothetical protein
VIQAFALPDDETTVKLTITPDNGETYLYPVISPACADLWKRGFIASFDGEKGDKQIDGGCIISTGSLRDAGRMLYSVSSDTKEKNYSDLARKFLDNCTAKLPGSRFVLERGKGLVLR